MIAKTHTFYKIISIFLLLSATIIQVNSLNAEPSSWLIPQSVTDKSDNTPLGQEQPLLAGHTYNMTMTVEVPFTQNFTEFNVVLMENLTRGGSQFWYLKSSNYTGYQTQLFTPGEHTIRFEQKQGDLVLSVIFTVPLNTTSTKFNNITLRYIRGNSEIVYARIVEGAVVGTIKRSISDSVIEEYLTTVIQKNNLVATGKMDASYKGVIDNILNQSSYIYSLGLPDKATQMLSAIDPTLFPSPPSYMLQTALMVGIGVLIIIVIAVLIMYSRLNTRAQLNTGSLDSTRDELASLEVTAGRYDENLASQLKRLREKISEEG